MAIGTQQFYWEDKTRLDAYYGGTRKVNVQVWYPSDAVLEETPKTPYVLFGDQLFNSFHNWSKEDVERVQKIQTGSFLGSNIKPDAGSFPLLVFSPSLGGNLSYYTYYAEYFAKRGYMVMGVNHLYESEAIVYDRNVYLANTQFYDRLKSLKIPEEITADEYREQMGARQMVLAQDMVFAVDQLIANTEIGKLIDAERIGVFGHSIGGSAAIYSSLLDHRIKAVIDLDGTPPTIALTNGINVPFLFIEDLTDYKNHAGYAKMHQRRNDFCTQNKAPSWRILIKGFSHNSFLDSSYYLAEDSMTMAAEQEKLDLVLKHMNQFLAYYLLKLTTGTLTFITTEKEEVFTFDK